MKCYLDSVLAIPDNVVQSLPVRIGCMYSLKPFGTGFLLRRELRAHSSCVLQTIRNYILLVDIAVGISDG